MKREMTKVEIHYTTPDGPRACVVDLAVHPIESLRSLRVDGVEVPLENVRVFKEQGASARRNLATTAQYWRDRFAAGPRPQEEKMKPWQAFTTESRRAFHLSDVLLFISGAMAMGASVVFIFILLTNGLQYESTATMMWALAFCFLALERRHERGKKGKNGKK